MSSVERVSWCWSLFSKCLNNFSRTSSSRRAEKRRGGVDDEHDDRDDYVDVFDDDDDNDDDDDGDARESENVNEGDINNDAGAMAKTMPMMQPPNVATYTPKR